MVAKQLPDEVRSNTAFEPRWLIENMFVHERTMTINGQVGYARPLNPRRVKELTSDWDEQAIGVLLLSMRDDGSAAIIDGRHRAHVASTKGRKSLPAYVYIDLTIEQEARLYRRFGETLSQSARDRYLAALVEGNPTILEIDRILHAHGLHVASGMTGPGSVQAIDALTRVVKDLKFTGLDRTLTLLVDAFGDDPRAYTANLIKGASLFVARYWEHAVFTRRYDSFLTKLAETSVVGLNSKAAEFKLSGNDSPGATGKAFLKVFNSGRGQKLPDWVERLYTPEQKKAMARRLVIHANPVKAAKRRANGHG